MQLKHITVCRDGRLEYSQNVQVSRQSGLICEKLDVVGDNSVLKLGEDKLVAPGFIELQTNGLIGIHFTTLGNDSVKDEEHLQKISREMARNGVTAWYATVPTVAEHSWKQVGPQQGHSV